jgi:hypothetical protein
MNNSGAGDIRVDTLKIGDIDLASFNQATYAGFNIYEDILNPFGPLADISVIDHSDALGKTKLNGSFDKDVEIRFSPVNGGGTVGFKFKMLSNKNLKDGSTNEQGSGKNKQYDIRCCSEEFLNAQGNYVQKSYNELTSKMVEDILKNNFKTTKQIELPDQTKGKRRMIFHNEHPMKALRKLNNEHVSNQNKSSLYVTFQQSENGNQKYVFSTFEHLFSQGPVATLKQSTTLDFKGSSFQDKQNAIISMKVDDSFFTPTRPFSKTESLRYDPTTGKNAQISQNQTQYKAADGSTNVYNSPPSKTKAVPVFVPADAANEDQKTYLGDARKNKLDYLGHLSQNFATIEVIGNPSIKLGSVVNLDIFKKANSGGGAGESQFNGKALVVSIRHKIKPLGQTPRYTMILGVVKASYKEGGGSSG